MYNLGQTLKNFSFLLYLRSETKEYKTTSSLIQKICTRRQWDVQTLYARVQNHALTQPSFQNHMLTTVTRNDNQLMP